MKKKKFSQSLISMIAFKNRKKINEIFRLNVKETIGSGNRKYIVKNIINKK